MVVVNPPPPPPSAISRTFIGISGYGAFTFTANALLLVEFDLPSRSPLTGIRFYNGSAAVGNLLSGLYDSNGNQLAGSASTPVVGTFAMQPVAFTGGPLSIAPGVYFMAMMASSSSLQGLSSSIPQTRSSAVVQGGFTLPATVPLPVSGAGASLPMLETY